MSGKYHTNTHSIIFNSLIWYSLISIFIPISRSLDCLSAEIKYKAATNALEEAYEELYEFTSSSSDSSGSRISKIREKIEMLRARKKTELEKSRNSIITVLKDISDFINKIYKCIVDNEHRKSIVVEKTVVYHPAYNKYKDDINKLTFNLLEEQNYSFNLESGEDSLDCIVSEDGVSGNLPDDIWEKVIIIVATTIINIPNNRCRHHNRYHDVTQLLQSYCHHYSFCCYYHWSRYHI